MHNLFDYLTRKLSRSFSITFTLLFIVINLSVITINTVYINATIDNQNKSLVDMIEHLVQYTDDETVITYLEHYGHTHEVRVQYSTLDGLYSHSTEISPTNGDSYVIMHHDIEYAVLVVDNAQSNLLMANLTYLLIINALLVSLYIFFIVYFNKRMKKQNILIIDDMRQLQQNIKKVSFTKHYHFDEFFRIDNVFEQTIQKLDTIQSKHREVIQGLAHDIKTPLTIIQGLVDGVVQGRIDLDDHVKKSIHEETVQISKLIDRIINEAFDESYEIIDFSSLLRDVIERHQLLFEQQGITLRYDIAHDVWLKGDIHGLRQVIEHILQNSLHHTSSGENIWIQLEPTLLKIKDEGQGMNQTTLNHVFERTQSEKGSGIGLTLVKKILDAHGYRIDISSTLGEGTAVTIYFDS